MSQAAANNDLKKSFIDRFKTFEKELNGHSKSQIHQIRKKAIASFDKLGLPGLKNEEYKYTNITRALTREFDFSDNVSDTSVDGDMIRQNMIPDLDAHSIVLIDGKYSDKYSDFSVDHQKINILGFEEAYTKHHDLIDQNFARYANYENDGFTALNTAFSQDGIFIKVNNNTIIKKPIAIYHITTAYNKNIFSQPRNLFLIGKNSQVDIIENHIALGNESNFSNMVTEISLDANAYVNHFQLQLANNKAYHIGNIQAYQNSDSTFNTTAITLSGKLIRNNLNIALDAEGCQTNMYGLYVLKDKQHVDNHTVVDHLKPNSYSNELYKGILDDNSNGVFNGKIFVRQNAQKTNAFQSNKNIILSDNATINTKPQLEIWADDVKCSHGATTGQLDEDQMFYLRARGLSKESARSMLLYAFATDAITGVKIEALRKYIDRFISDRLKK